MSKLVDRQTLPRVAAGVDWGKERVVLIKKGPTCLVWVPGQSYTNRGFTTYHVGKLLLLGPDYDLLGGRIQDGGRLSTKMLREHRAIIDKVFGEGTTDQLDSRKTLLVD